MLLRYFYALFTFLALSCDQLFHHNVIRTTGLGLHPHSLRIRVTLRCHDSGTSPFAVYCICIGTISLGQYADHELDMVTVFTICAGFLA